MSNEMTVREAAQNRVESHTTSGALFMVGYEQDGSVAENEWIRTDAVVEVRQ